MAGEIRIDCYVAVLEKFKREYPNAYFDVITRKVIPGWTTQASVLSPTWDLLNMAKKEHWAMDQYYRNLESQFMNDDTAQVELEWLRELVRKGNMLFLVCFEKNPAECHRTFVKQLIEREL